MTRFVGLSALLFLIIVSTGCGPALNIRRSSNHAPHCELFVEDEPGSKNYVHIGSTRDNFREDRAHPQPVVTQNKDGTVDTYQPEPEYGNVFYMLPIELKDENFSAVICYDRIVPGYAPYKVCQEFTVDGSRYTERWVPLDGIPEIPYDDVLGERAQARRAAAAAQAQQQQQQQMSAGPNMVPAGGR